jgi:hypothetical protein
VPRLKKSSQVSNLSYRPEQQVCPACQSKLKRDHILWRKYIIFSSGAQIVTSWAYRCVRIDCPDGKMVYRSARAEKIHLRQRRFSRELIVRIGHQHFWQHQTMYEIHNWLTQELHIEICEREVAKLLVDFLALLSAAQPGKIRRKLSNLKWLIISIDGMQPEKGNDCLYIVRELQCGVTLLAENLEESSQVALSERILEPLKEMAKKLGLAWRGVISDAQETLHLAVAQSLQGVAYQACQSHCLRDAGGVTFEADRAMKTDIKASFRKAVPHLRKRIQALPANDPFRTILMDYVSVLRSFLLVGGVAPFELGGIKIFDGLEDLEASVIRCQKKVTTRYYAV